MIHITNYITINNTIYAACKKAPFPFNIILWIFKKTMCKADSTVSMINPFTKNIYTIIDNNSIVKDNKPYITLSLYLHEFIHLCQVERDGLFKFLFKYLWYNIRYGYRNNLYEVNARYHSEVIFNSFLRMYGINDITCVDTNENFKIYVENGKITLQYKYA